MLLQAPNSSCSRESSLSISESGLDTSIKPETSTYSYHKSANEPIQGVCKIYKKYQKLTNTDAPVEQEVIATGIKVINLLSPYHKGNNTGLTKAKTPKAFKTTKESLE